MFPSDLSAQRSCGASSSTSWEAALGQDVTIYMAEAGAVPHLPEDGRVVAFMPQSTSATVVAPGAPLAVAELTVADLTVATRDPFHRRDKLLSLSRPERTDAEARAARNQTTAAPPSPGASGSAIPRRA
jgi:hypothetical protein